MTFAERSKLFAKTKPMIVAGAIAAIALGALAVSKAVAARQ